MIPYNPANWYWIVAASPTQVWSSAQAEYLPVTDATYTAWLAAGGRATNIDSEDSLSAVLAAQYPQGWPPTLAQQATAQLAEGLAVTSTSTPALNGTYSVSDMNTRLNVVSQMVSIATTGNFTNGTTSLGWLDTSAVSHTFNPTQFRELAIAMGAYFTAMELIILTNSGTLPSASVTIA